MNWGDVAGFIGTAAPLLGGVLAGPAGAAAGRLVASVLGVENSPAAVNAALRSDPEALAKVRALELEHAADMRRLAVQAEQHRMAADTQRILAINSTMQAEGKSEHWPQWSWRPFTGFFFAPAIIAVYFVLPMLSITVPNVPELVWVMWGSVLGVTAWHRGVQKRVQSGDQRQGLLHRLGL